MGIIYKQEALLRNIGKYQRYVVEHPNGTKSFGRKTNCLEKNLVLAKKYLASIDKN